MKQKSLFEEMANNNTTKKHVNEPLPFDCLAIDIEATGKDPVSDAIVGISLCKEKGIAYYVPIRHHKANNLNDALPILKEVLENQSISKIGHNLKFDILMLMQEGIYVQGDLYDTMLASYLLDPNSQNHGLEEVSIKYLNHRKRAFSDILGPHKTFAEVPLEEAIKYAAEDAELAFELKEILFKKIDSEGLRSLYFNIEMPLIFVLAEMQQTGIKLDIDLIIDLSKELERELSLLESKIYNLAGKRFNINSSQQLSKILFEELGLKTSKKTKTGYSTNVSVLEQLSIYHDLPREILHYRSLYKLKTTYLDTLPNLVNKKTGRIHTSFNQTITATGRLSSSEPNLQNIPIKGELGTKIRQAFIAENGSVLLSADYSQIELRILAHMSKDKGLLEAFQRGVDIHSKTASEIFNVPTEKVTSELRRIAKTINFGIIYGISPFGLSESLGISPKEAATLIDSYFRRHNGVREYIEKTIKDVRKSNYVITLLGRKRQIPEINSTNSNTRQQAERIAINTPIQGTAADLIKIAMISISEELKKKKFKTKMLLQIHDELLFEVPNEEVEEVTKIIKNKMESALSLSVPLEVDIKLGKNWAEVK
ncbi:MAG: DNA polymerase I [Thermodesulfovibrionales bacterium]|nr:DNA polymerase I [Thermodesulfovibrionales bacterium]